MKVHQAIVKLREDLNLSQQEFAEKCGFSLERVQQIEHESGHYRMNESERNIIRTMCTTYTPDTPRPELLLHPKILAMHESQQLHKKKAIFKPIVKEKPTESKPIDPKFEELHHKLNFLEKHITRQKLAHDLADIVYDGDSCQKGSSRPRTIPVTPLLLGTSYPNEKVLAAIDRMCRGFGYKPKNPVGKGDGR